MLISNKVSNSINNQDQPQVTSLLHPPFHNGFTVLHHNIRNFNDKSDEFLNSVLSKFNVRTMHY
jgi:hypothetical protein